MKNEGGLVSYQRQALMAYKCANEHSGENERIKMEILPIEARDKTECD